VDCSNLTFLLPWNNVIFFLLTSLASCGPVFASSQRLKQKVRFENDANPDIVIEYSVITNNGGGSWYPTYDGISMHSDTPISVTDSIISYNSQE
jgi:hypothetical protein